MLETRFKASFFMTCDHTLITNVMIGFVYLQPHMYLRQ